MDWWSTSTTASSAAAHSASFAGPAGQLELQLDNTPGTPAPPTSSSVASPPHASFFDPWLNCDDLDLGAILQHHHQHHHHHQVNHSSSSRSNNAPFSSTNHQDQSVSSSMEFVQQQTIQTPAGYQSMGANHAARDNKQQILSIINNSRHTNEQQQQQQQQQVIHGRGSGLDPSSLGSSPINSLNSNYSLSPHSPLHFNQQHQQHQQHHQHNSRSLVLFSPVEPSGHNSFMLNNGALELKPSVINPQSDLNSNQQQQQQQSSYCFAQANDCYNSDQKKEQLQRYGQQQQLQTAPTGRGTATPLAQRQYNKSTSSASQAAGGGNSLLTSGNSKTQTGENQRKQQQQQRKSTLSTSGALNKNGNVKLRRCRHITDYVLAEEEKRLLIKEGHSDFPMTCQSRPLTKSEERILRKIRRKIRNKRSAQCSRQRKKEYVEDLERRYGEICRENEQLKQMIARMQQQQQQQQAPTQNHNQYQIEDLQQQQMQAPATTTTNNKGCPTFSDDDICLEGQSSNESVDMNWKDIFQPQSNCSAARLVVASAVTGTTTTTTTTSNQRQQPANVIYS